MKEANYGFPGHNVRITETIENKYEVPYFDYVISKAIEELTEAEKFKIVRFMIRTFNKPYLFPQACYAKKKSDITALLSNSENDIRRLKTKRPHLKSPFIGY